LSLPNAEEAHIDDAKISGYLLSLTHPVGRFKAHFFIALGFSAGEPEALTGELLRIAVEAQDSECVETPHGNKYVVRGTLSGPNGRSAPIVTVWIVSPQSTSPRFITAYPS